MGVCTKTNSQNKSNAYFQNMSDLMIIDTASWFS